MYQKNQVPISGDDADFLEAIYKRHAKQLYFYGLSCCSDIDIVEDAIHDVFIDLCQHQERFEKIRNLKYYLMASLRYTIHQRLEKEVLSTELKKEEELEDFFERDAQDIYIEQEEKAGHMQIAEDLLSRLTPHQREVIYLRFSEGLSFNKIAELMTIHRQSAQNLFQQSINKLRKEISRISIKNSVK